MASASRKLNGIPTSKMFRARTVLFSLVTINTESFRSVQLGLWVIRRRRIRRSTSLKNRFPFSLTLKSKLLRIHIVYNHDFLSMCAYFFMRSIETIYWPNNNRHSNSNDNNNLCYCYRCDLNDGLIVTIIVTIAWNSWMTKFTIYIIMKWNCMLSCKLLMHLSIKSVRIAFVALQNR